MTNDPQNFDMQALMAKAQEMQKKMQEAQDQLANAEVIGEAGGSLVKVILTGRYDARRVSIAEAALRESKEILEGLIAAAINDAVRKVEKISRGKIGALAKEIGVPVEKEDAT